MDPVAVLGLSTSPAAHAVAADARARLERVVASSPAERTLALWRR